MNQRTRPILAHRKRGQYHMAFSFKMYECMNVWIWLCGTARGRVRIWLSADMYYVSFRTERSNISVRLVIKGQISKACKQSTRWRWESLIISLTETVHKIFYLCFLVLSLGPCATELSIFDFDKAFAALLQLTKSSLLAHCHKSNRFSAI